MARWVLLGKKDFFIDFIAQRANGAFDDTVVKHEASLREFCSHLAGDLKVVAVQILSVGGIENRGGAAEKLSASLATSIVA